MERQRNIPGDFDDERRLAERRPAGASACFAVTGILILLDGGGIPTMMMKEKLLFAVIYTIWLHCKSPFTLHEEDLFPYQHTIRIKTST